MTYPAENFYPGFDVPRSPRRRTGLAVLATIVAEAVRKAVAHYKTFRRERTTIRQLSLLDDATGAALGPQCEVSNRSNEKETKGTWL